MSALLCFYNATHGLNWNISSNDGCSFEGVTCSSQNGQSTVIKLNLTEKSLSGTIPGCVSNLTNLQKLILANNFLEGSIPSENLVYISQKKKGHYKKKRLLTGTIPLQIDNLISLRNLSLYNNKFRKARGKSQEKKIRYTWLGV
ncbi:hypothetical protein RFI_11967, partial [Reticulomyxa filosa]